VIDRKAAGMARRLLLHGGDMTRTIVAALLATLSFSCATSKGAQTAEANTSAPKSEDLQLIVEHSPYRRVHSMFPTLIPELVTVAREEFGYTDQQVDAVNSAVQASCSSAQLNDAVASYVSAHLSSAEIADAAAFVKEPANERVMSELLGANDLDPEQMQARIERVQAAPANPARDEAIKRSLNAFQFPALIQLTKDMTTAALRIAVAAKNPPLTDAEFQEVLTAAFGELPDADSITQEQVELIMRVAFVDVSDEDLIRAVNWLDSETGHKYLRTAEGGALTAIQDCTKKVEAQVRPTSAQ